MNKKIFYFFVFTLFFPISCFALDFPDVNSKIVEIYDLNDEKVLYEVDSTKRASIASLTKIVTTITAIETIPNLEERVVVTRDILNTVAWDASKAGLKVGDSLTYMDLLYASMLPSGADATNTIAIASSGSIENYVIKMNNLVSSLKLENTHFVNVTGLDQEGHYSTADDIRVILSYALKNELFRKIYTTREYTLSSGLKVSSTILTYNKNSSMDTSKILGSKTGYTGDAGYCLSSLSDINTHEVLIIVLGAEHRGSIYYNILDTSNLISFLLEHYKNQLLVKKDTVLKKIPVRFSKTDFVSIKVGEDVYKYLPSDYDPSKFEMIYDGLEKLSFKDSKGEKLGTIRYLYDGKEIKKDTVTLTTKLDISIPKIFHAYYPYLILLIVLVLFFLILRKKLSNKKNCKKR